MPIIASNTELGKKKRAKVENKSNKQEKLSAKVFVEENWGQEIGLDAAS